jgi:hypothetical protein
MAPTLAVSAALPPEGAQSPWGGPASTEPRRKRAPFMMPA